MHAASVTIPCTDPDEARVLRQALEVEVADGPEGTTAILTVEGSDLTVAVEAGDVSSLRAALNSVLRLLDAARRVAGAQ